MTLTGTLFSLPYEVLFFAMWLWSSLARPLGFATLICLVVNPFAAKRKLMLVYNTFHYMIFCNDKKWKEPDEPSYSKVEKVETKTIIFVRHGESTWNETFNRGDRKMTAFLIYYIPTMVKAFLIEWYFLVTGQDRESWFYDAPLSEKGKRQAEGVQKFLRTDLKYSTPKEARLIKLMLGEPVDDDNKNGTNGKKKVQGSSSQLVSSNLRRALSTLLIGFKDRLDRQLEGDNVLMLSQLQEISRNPDALCITPPKGKAVSAYTDPKFLAGYYDTVVDTSMHTGNKPVNTNGLIRMQKFCEAAFKDIQKDSIVIAGHSLWFRSFFRTFLPRDFDHISKVKKLQNGACVGFTLEKRFTDKGEIYVINPKSIVTLYGGF